MNKVFLRFSFIFFILFALFFLIDLGNGLLPLFFPTYDAHLPLFLKEDEFFGFLLSLFKDHLLAYPFILVSSFIITFSFALKLNDLTKEKERGIPASKALLQISGLIVFCGIIFSGISLFFVPWTQLQISNLTYKRELTQKLEDAYFELKKETPTDLKKEKENLEARLSLVQRLSVLRPKQALISAGERLDYEFEIQILSSHLQLLEFFALRSVSNVVEEDPFPSLSVKQLLARARSLLHPENPKIQPDFYAANILSLQAFRRIWMDPKSIKTSADLIKEAQTLANESWSAIYASTILVNERLKASYFFRKGKSLGDYQFKNYLEAYYGFNELYHENPNDEEVAKYFKLSEKEVRKKIIFIQDVELLFRAPGLANLAFRNPLPRNQNQSESEIIRIESFLSTNQGVYVKGFELMRLDSQGKVLRHWKAPYGRWTADGVEFPIWDLNEPKSHFPEIFPDGRDEDFLVPGSAETPLFKPEVSYKDILLLNSNPLLAQTLSTWELLTQGQVIESMGANSLPLTTEYFLRLFGPIGFLVILWGVFLGSWVLRVNAKTKKTIPWQILVPILPFLTEFFLYSFGWATRLITAQSIRWFGLFSTSVIMVSVSVALLIFLATLSWTQLKKSLKV